LTSCHDNNSGWVLEEMDKRRRVCTTGKHLYHWCTCDLSTFGTPNGEKEILLIMQQMIYESGIISLIVQFIVGIIDYVALKVKIDSKDEILKDLLKLELIVQIVEFTFYVWLIYSFNKVSKNITPYRYIDWSITTPLMLISLSVFLKHDGKSTTERLSDFLSNNKGSIMKIVGLNALMLLCGLLGEFGFLSVYTAAALGFIPFVLNFKYIKDTFLPPFEKDTQFKHYLFYWFVFVWSLYGVFSTMNYKTKNTGYNILDIFAKNFFGIFLAYVIQSKSVVSKT
jgi:bacteriorhodopsin